MNTNLFEHRMLKIREEELKVEELIKYYGKYNRGH